MPHAYRITSAKAEMLIICTPGGSEGLYRYVGRDRATQRPEGWAITPERADIVEAVAGASAHYSKLAQVRNDVDAVSADISSPLWGVSHVALRAFGCIVDALS